KKVDSKGAGLTLKDLTEMGYFGRQIRYWLSSSHYRKPVIFSKERLKDAGRSLKRLDTFTRSLHNVNAGQHYGELQQLLYDIKNGFTSAMDDDLNISAAMASIFKAVKKVNILISEKKIDPEDASKIEAAFRKINSVLKIFNFQDEYSDSKIEKLMAQREKARLEKKWELADRLRDQLVSLGVSIQDRKLNK
ncbi:MAG: cysteine--tRNA ligase, partial [Deltaproteobacteria bacterium]|nr:cysteine--tRNA ligase [Deltaproteobacteria bacterium]